MRGILAHAAHQPRIPPSSAGGITPPPSAARTPGEKEDRRRLPIGASGRREGGWNLGVRSEEHITGPAFKHETPRG